MTGGRARAGGQVDVAGGESELHEFIGQVYEAAADPVRWREVAPAIARAFGAESAAVCVIRQRPVPAIAVPSATDNFDSWALAMVRQRRQLPDDGPAGFDADDTPAAIGHLLGAVFDISDDLTGSVAVHRVRGGERFDPADRQRLGLFVPHLQRALQIRSRLDAVERDRGLSLQILEGLSIGAVVVAADGKMLFANAVADRLLRTSGAITVSQGRIRPGDPRHADKLKRAIADAASTSRGAGTGAGDVVTLPRAGGAPLIVLVSPLRAPAIGFGSDLPAALMLFSSGESATVSEPRLADAYGLTPAEARLLSALVAGYSLAQYAAMAGVSINTAKTHLRNVFQKMGHNRQVDVVRAVLGDPTVKYSRQQNS